MSPCLPSPYLLPQSSKRKIKTAAKGGSKSSSKSDPLFQKNARSFRIGGDIRAKKDLGRFVRWPKYIRIQRQRKVCFTEAKRT